MRKVSNSIPASESPRIGLAACSPLGILLLNKRRNTLFILSQLYRW
jgi:hypothetical protein